MLLSRTGEEPAVRDWLAVFAQHLQAVGHAGQVTAAPQPRWPAWLSEPGLGYQLHAFVSYRTVDLTELEEQQRRAGWNVAADVTDRVADAAVSWGRFDGANGYLTRLLHTVQTQSPDMAGLLARGVSRFGMARVEFIRAEPRRLISVSFSPQGQVTYGVLDETLGWQDRLAQVARALRLMPDERDLGFVQHSAANTHFWDSLATGKPRLPHIEEYHLHYNRHLHAQFTADAGGLQVLTDAHLARALDLSDWIIEPLGGGRHFVQARDLDAWYANLDPDPEVLHKARRDFGAMILTVQTVEANPPPWR